MLLFNGLSLFLEVRATQVKQLSRKDWKLKVSRNPDYSDTGT